MVRSLLFIIPASVQAGVGKEVSEEIRQIQSDLPPGVHITIDAFKPERQAITLDQELLTHFSTTYDFTGHNLPLTRPQDFWDVSEQGRATLDLFGEKLHIKGSGNGTSHMDCSGHRLMPCKYSGHTDAIFTGMKTQVRGEVFVDGTTGYFGFRGVDRDANRAGVEAQGAFCAVVMIPKRVLPPPQVLRQTISPRLFERIQQRLNKLPHTTEDGVATFVAPTNGYAKEHNQTYADASFSVRVDTGAPVQAKTVQHKYFHYNNSKGYVHGYDHDADVEVKFGNFVKPDFPQPFTCPTGSSTDLDAHPEVLGSLAALDLMVQQMRQYEDLAWLPEQPSAFFVEQIATKDQPEQENRNWTLLVGSLVAGMSGGFVVLALANFLTKKRHQEPLLSDA